MILGFIGSETSRKVVQEVVEKELPEITLINKVSPYYEDSAALAEELQSGGTVDALLFSGPAAYEYAIKRVEKRIPWGFLPHNRMSLLMALNEAAVKFKEIPGKISIDRYPKELVEETLNHLGVKDFEIFKPDYDFEDPAFEHKLYRFHRACYKSGKVSLCLTSMNHIVEPLTTEGIPCIRIHPVVESVLEQIYHLQLQLLAPRKIQNEIAIIVVYLDYVFDDEKDLPLREWEKVRFLNKIREYAYSIAHNLNGAIFFEGINLFYIVTNRDNFENIFLQNHEHSKLLNLARESANTMLKLGIGIGSNNLEAKSRANMALNNAMKNASSSTFIVENEESVSSLPDAYSNIDELQQKKLFSERIKLGVGSLEKIAACIAEDEALTSEEIAEKLGITERSANRLIAKLEDGGSIVVVGKRAREKGRPARIMQISLPDAFYGN